MSGRGCICGRVAIYYDIVFKLTGEIYSPRKNTDHHGFDKVVKEIFMALDSDLQSIQEMREITPYSVGAVRQMTCCGFIIISL